MRGINYDPQFASRVRVILLQRANERVLPVRISSCRWPLPMQESVEMGEQTGHFTPLATRVAGILGFLERESARLVVVRLREALNQVSTTGDTVS